MGGKFVFGHTLYSFAVVSATPVIACALTLQRLQGTETTDTVRQRWGYATVERQDGELLWFHVLSIGEGATALPLIQGLLQEYPDLNILVTAASAEAHLLLQRSIRTPRVSIQLAPVDTPGAVERFLDYWKPVAGVFLLLAETNVWPLLIKECKWRSIPLALMNVHVGSLTFRTWVGSALGKAWLSDLMSCFSLIMPQTPTDAAKLLLLGAPLSVLPTTTAQLKYASAIAVNLVGWKLQKPQQTAVDLLKQAVGGRFHWLVAHSHEGEEMELAHMHLSLTRGADPGIPGLLTIMCPRQRARCALLKRHMRELGIRASLWSEGRDLADPRGVEVLLVDESHQLALLYAANDVVFVGNTLQEGGRGHSLADVAVCGCTILTGPHLGHYQMMADELNAAAETEAMDIEQQLDVTVLSSLPLVYIDTEGRHCVLPKAAAGTLDNANGSFQPCSSALSSELPSTSSSSAASASTSSISAGPPQDHLPPPANQRAAHTLTGGLGSSWRVPPTPTHSVASMPSAKLIDLRLDDGKGGAHPVGRYVSNRWRSDDSVAYAEPFEAPPSRFLGRRVLLPTQLPLVPNGPAVWQVEDTQTLAAALQRLYEHPLECCSRGYAAAMGAARLAKGLTATLMETLDAAILRSVLAGQQA